MRTEAKIVVSRAVPARDEVERCQEATQLCQHVDGVQVPRRVVTHHNAHRQQQGLAGAEEFAGGCHVSSSANMCVNARAHATKQKERKKLMVMAMRLKLETRREVG